MNKRQAKKNFKKKYGCNPPRTLTERITFAFSFATKAIIKFGNAVEKAFGDAKKEREREKENTIDDNK